jgi:hypothetical protein
MLSVRPANCLSIFAISLPLLCCSGGRSGTLPRTRVAGVPAPPWTRGSRQTNHAARRVPCGVPVRSALSGGARDPRSRRGTAPGRSSSCSRAAPALADHLQQAAPRVVVLLVRAEVPVRWLIRAVSSATWTRVEPRSFSWSWYFWMMGFAIDRHEPRPPQESTLVGKRKWAAARSPVGRGVETALGMITDVAPAAQALVAPSPPSTARGRGLVAVHLLDQRRRPREGGPRAGGAELDAHLAAVEVAAPVEQVQLDGGGSRGRWGAARGGGARARARRRPSRAPRRSPRAGAASPGRRR